MASRDRWAGYLERGEDNPSLDLAFAIAALFELPIEAVFSATPIEPMSARLYGRTSDATEPSSRA